MKHFEDLSCWGLDKCQIHSTERFQRRSIVPPQLLVAIVDRELKFRPFSKQENSKITILQVYEDQQRDYILKLIKDII